MDSNLAILDETKTVIKSLEAILCEMFGESCWHWEVRSVSCKGPSAWVTLYAPHNHILPIALKLANHSGAWQYVHPLQFDILTFATKVTVTLREIPEGDR